MIFAAHCRWLWNDLKGKEKCRQNYFCRWIWTDNPADDSDQNTNVFCGRYKQIAENSNYRGADVQCYIKADGIILKNKFSQTTENLQNHAPQGQQKK